MPSSGWEDWARISYVLPSPATGNPDFPSSFRPMLKATAINELFPLWKHFTKLDKDKARKWPEQISAELLKHFKRKLKLFRVLYFVTKRKAYCSRKIIIYRRLWKGFLKCWWQEADEVGFSGHSMRISIPAFLLLQAVAGFQRVTFFAALLAGFWGVSLLNLGAPL